MEYLPIKMTEMLPVLLRGVNFRFWSHLGCLGWKVTLVAYSGISLMAVYIKKIYKKSCDIDRTEI